RPLAPLTSLWIDVDDSYHSHACPDIPAWLGPTVGRLRTKSGKPCWFSGPRHAAQPALDLLDPTRKVRIFSDHFANAFQAVNDCRVVTAAKCVADFDELHPE